MFHPTRPLPVIVGFDGSTHADIATGYGADEATLRGRELRLVHAFTWPWIYPPFGTEYSQEERGPRVRMLKLLNDTAQKLEQDRPGVAMTTRLFDGPPGGVLVAASRDADLLVVGHRGTGGFSRLLAGSVATQAAGHAHCPVIVVRGDPPPAGARSCSASTARRRHMRPRARPSSTPTAGASN